MMPWLVGLKRARELIYFGDTIDAEEAKTLGIVNRVVAPDQLDSKTLEYARRLALVGPEALFSARTTINRALESQGILQAFNSSVDLMAPTYTTESRAQREFNAKVEEIGLAGAFKWRRQQFDR
jgi:enoyl-CoA hydratase